MKDFDRTDFLFSLCGLNCGLCPMRLGGYCPGCGGGAGNQSCAIAACSLQHDKVEYCYQCVEFPCEKFQGTEEYDSFITHQHQLSNIKRAQEIGLDSYHREQIKKVEILQILLDKYNDGRRKTLYCLAVNLLSLKDLELIMKQISEITSLRSLPIKEQADYIASLLLSRADQLGIVLKLRKREK